MASITSNANGTFTTRWVIGRDRKCKMRRDSRRFPTRNEAITHKVAVEQCEAGTGKDSLTSRGLHWIDDRGALGKLTEKTAVGYRQKIEA